MSYEIVRRLREGNHKKFSFLNEELPADDEELEQEDELDTEEEDTELEEPAEDTEDDGSAPPQGPLPSTSSHSSSSTPSSSPDEEVDEEEPLELEKDREKENVNPLDNQYAVQFAMGDQVALAYADGTATDAEAVIEGYDAEGFYRIKLASGMTINGLTDIALTSLVKGTKESKCVCGGTEFITEGKHVVCDKCGRRLRESNDPLRILDKTRDSDKRMIRSEAKPMSTSNRPNISENIRKAFKRDLQEDRFTQSINSLRGEFWTRLPELVADIEDLGYDVLEANSEYVVIVKEGSDDEYQIPLGGTSRTLTLDFDRAKYL